MLPCDLLWIFGGGDTFSLTKTVRAVRDMCGGTAVGEREGEGFLLTRVSLKPSGCSFLLCNHCAQFEHIERVYMHLSILVIMGILKSI